MKYFNHIWPFFDCKENIVFRLLQNTITIYWFCASKIYVFIYCQIWPFWNFLQRISIFFIWQPWYKPQWGLWAYYNIDLMRIACNTRLSALSSSFPSYIEINVKLGKPIIHTVCFADLDQGFEMIIFQSFLATFLAVSFLEAAGAIAKRVTCLKNTVRSKLSKFGLHCFDF